MIFWRKLIKAMQLLENINTFLRKPFPEEESKLEVLKYNGWIGLFVFFFLYTFQPFGIHTIESNKLLICLGFGVSTLELGTVAAGVALHYLSETQHEQLQRSH